MRTRLPVPFVSFLIGVGLVAVLIVGCTEEAKDHGEDFDPTPTQQATPSGSTGIDEPTATTAPVDEPDPTAEPTTDPGVGEPSESFVILELLATGDIDPNRFPEIRPGDGELHERLFPEAPPSAPHSVSDIKITVDRNRCTECHTEGKTIGDSTATKIPISHFTDALTGEVSAELDPRRYLCTSCHVPQVTDPVPYE